jgi:hypothetical protein
MLGFGNRVLRESNIANAKEMDNATHQFVEAVFATSDLLNVDRNYTPWLYRLQKTVEVWTEAMEKMWQPGGHL